MNDLNVLLISTYDLGRQPFGLASPAAWLREAGANVRCLDLAVQQFDAAVIHHADLVAIHLPMHMATRMAVPVIERVQQINPDTHLCCFGLYAPVNAAYLRRLGVGTILGGEFETGLVSLVKRLIHSTDGQTSEVDFQPEPLISLDRQQFLVPDRSGLPELAKYAQLMTPNGQQVLVGYTEASRGCKHLCRHCPIVPVYGGRFRIVQQEVVLADIRQQVEAGARHITFGDPDFFNGPGHALPLVTALHAEFPWLTYDVTLKVEHLLKYAKQLPALKSTGCLFITTAVESFDDRMLAIFDKGHTRADFEAALSLARQMGLLLIPTFVAFTPWTTLEGYRAFLAEVARFELVEQVAPIQYTLRLLVPAGSRLLELPEAGQLIGPLDEVNLSHRWRNPDPRVDQLQRELELLVHHCTKEQFSRVETFQELWDRTHQALEDEYPEPTPVVQQPANGRPVPYLTEPWYC
jgi:radical SAM superfamily enzyme YgiQ (UPF0313 family)